MRKKLGLLCLALILAMGSLGVGYALWSENLYIEGTVNTGDVDVEWSIHGTGDNEEKDVSSITADIIGDTLVVTITNAYPCVTYWLDFDIHNIGTIPVHVGEFVLIKGVLPPEFFLFEWFGPSQLHQNEEGLGRISVHFDNSVQEGTTYSFGIGVTCGQYNEFGIGDPFVGP